MGFEKEFGIRDVCLFLTHRKDFMKIPERVVFGENGTPFLKERCIPVQQVRGVFQGLVFHGRPLYYLETQDYGKVTVETGPFGENCESVLRFIRESRIGGAEIILTISDDGLVCNLEDAKQKGRSFSTSYANPIVPEPFMDEFRNMVFERNTTTVSGTLMEVYNRGEVEVLSDGKHILIHAFPNGKLSVECLRNLRGQSVVVSSNQSKELEVSKEFRVYDRTLTRYGRKAVFIGTDMAHT